MVGARLHIAQLAADAATGCDDVACLLDGGGRWVTSQGPHTVEGVHVHASDMGLYDVEVHLCAYPAGLLELGSRVRGAVQEAADNAGLGDALGPVGVHIDGFIDPSAGEAA